MFVCTTKLPVIFSDYFLELSVILGGRPLGVHAGAHASHHASGAPCSFTAGVGIWQLG